MIKNFIKKLFKDRTSRLFIFLVLSAIVLPTTYSRYITTDAGSAVSYLAKWDVSFIPSENNNVNLVALNSNEANYLFSIQSLSEVACDYSISISNVPSDVSLVVDGNTSNVYTPNASGVISIPNLGGFDLNSLNTTNNHKLTFIANTTTTAVSRNLSLNVEILQRLGSGA